MKFLVKIFSLLCITLILSLLFKVQSSAEIDQQTIIAAWLFDEIEDDIVKDSSPNDNDGEIVGSPELVKGKFGDALEFDGQSGSVDIPSSESLNNVDDITILAWILLKREVTSGTWNAIAGKNPYTSGYLMWIQVRTEPCGLVYVDGQRFDNRSGTQIELNEWYHLAFTRIHDGEMKFFINGEMVKVAQSNKGIITALEAPIVIAGQSPQVIEGIIDEVIIFNVVLTEDDINKIMTKGLFGALSVSPEEKLSLTWGDIKVGN